LAYSPKRNLMLQALQMGILVRNWKNPRGDQNLTGPSLRLCTKTKKKRLSMTPLDLVGTLSVIMLKWGSTGILWLSLVLFITVSVCHFSYLSTRLIFIMLIVLSFKCSSSQSISCLPLISGLVSCLLTSTGNLVMRLNHQNWSLSTISKLTFLLISYQHSHLPISTQLCPRSLKTLP